MHSGLESDAIRTGAGQVKADLDGLDGRMSEHGIERAADVPDRGPDGLAEMMGPCLDRTNALRQPFGTLNAYVHFFVAADPRNARARRILSELEAPDVRLERQCSIDVLHETPRRPPSR